MSEVNFSARISAARSRKINAFTAKRGISNKVVVEHVIDNIDSLRPALDATCANTKKGGKK